MAETHETNVGAVVRLSPPQEGDIIWTASQAELGRNLPPGDGPGRIPFDWSFGPIKISGYIDTDSFGVGISVTIVGINLGTVYGNLKDGVGVNVDLFVAKGQLRFYLKNGNEFWVHLGVSITFDGTFEGDYKILSF